MIVCWYSFSQCCRRCSHMTIEWPVSIRIFVNLKGITFHVNSCLMLFFSLFSGEFLFPVAIASLPSVVEPKKTWMSDTSWLHCGRPSSYCGSLWLSTCHCSFCFLFGIKNCSHPCCLPIFVLFFDLQESWLEDLLALCCSV
jgi:hypothetical protein